MGLGMFVGFGTQSVGIRRDQVPLSTMYTHEPHVARMQEQVGFVVCCLWFGLDVCAPELRTRLQ